MKWAKVVGLVEFVRSIALATIAGSVIGAGYSYAVVADSATVAQAVAATPDIGTAIMALAMAVTGLGIKKSLPSKEAVTDLQAKLIEWAERDNEASKERNEFRENLRAWMSTVDANTKSLTDYTRSLKEAQDDIRNKLDAVSEKVIRIEAGCKFMGSTH